MAYLWIKAFHLMAVISWMAGLFYLPRLFAYHAESPVGSAQSETFKVMERKLLRIIMNPAMAATWFLGTWMLWLQPEWLSQPWFHLKAALVLGLTSFHMALARWRKNFLRDKNTKSSRFYRIANEIPTLAMIGIVILVIVKPF